MNQNIIYGKDNTPNIVSIESRADGFTDVFIQKDDGTVELQVTRGVHWILTNTKADEKSVLLEGNGYYKYSNQFDLPEDFEFAKKQFYKFKDRCFWINDPKERFMVRQGMSYYKGLKHNQVSILSFDLETTGIDLNDESKILIISNTFRDVFGKVTRKLFCYDEYYNEKDMLEAWTAWVRKVDPSIVLGHNLYCYDLGYLDYIAKRNNIELNLGRNDSGLRFNKWESKFRKDGSQTINYKNAYIYGREIVDSMHLAYKWDVKRNLISYGLKNIINQLGLEVKGRQFYDASLIRKNYMISEEWVKIKKYAEHDADDALALWDLMGAPSFYWTQSVPKSLQNVCSGATGSQINSILIRSYLQENHSLPKASECPHYSGGISIGKPGIYSNCFKVDLLSAYPSTILAYEIYDSIKDPKAHFLTIVQYFFDMRKEYKKKAKETGEQYYKDLDATMKIAINSMYGTCSTNGLLFNYPRGAALITEKCRGYIETAIQWATSKNLAYWKNV